MTEKDCQRPSTTIWIPGLKLEELNAEELKNAELKWVVDAQISIRKDPKFNQLSTNLGLIEED